MRELYEKYQLYKSKDGIAKHPPTPPDILGPFYKGGAPERVKLFGTTTIQITGRVRDTEGEVIEAKLDVWQADAGGVYDNVEFEGRGTQFATSDGYKILTVMPGDYDISDPDAPQPHEFRCAHIHFKISAPGYRSLTTQLYFPDDPYNATDHWFDKRRVAQCLDATKRLWSFDFFLTRESD